MHKMFPHLPVYFPVSQVFAHIWIMCQISLIFKMNKKLFIKSLSGKKSQQIFHLLWEDEWPIWP